MTTTAPNLSRFVCTWTGPEHLVHRERNDGGYLHAERCDGLGMPGDPTLCARHGGRAIEILTIGRLKDRGWNEKRIKAELGEAHVKMRNPNGPHPIRGWLAPVVYAVERGEMAA